MSWECLKKLKDLVFAVTIVGACVAAFLQFGAMRAEAGDVKQQIAQLAEIARDLRDPNLWLRNWLIAHGVPEEQARIWSNMPKGPVPDSTGAPIPNVPFLLPDELPELGVLAVWTADSTNVLDTLWNHVRVVKEK